MTFGELCSIIDWVTKELVKPDVEKGGFEVLKACSLCKFKNTVIASSFILLSVKSSWWG